MWIFTILFSALLFFKIFEKKHFNNQRRDLVFLYLLIQKYKLVSLIYIIYIIFLFSKFFITICHYKFIYAKDILLIKLSSAFSSVYSIINFSSCTYYCNWNTCFRFDVFHKFLCFICKLGIFFNAFALRKYDV